MTIIVIGTLISGFGIAAASSKSVHGAGRNLLAITVVVAAVAVVMALVAQALTLTDALNPNHPDEVKAWYRRGFDLHGRLAQLATGFLAVAALIGAVAGVQIVTYSYSVPSRPLTPSMAVTRTTSPDAGSATVSVQVVFRGVAPGQAAHASIRDPQAGSPFGADAAGGKLTCHGTLSSTDAEPVLTCHSG